MSRKSAPPIPVPIGDMASRFGFQFASANHSSSITGSQMFENQCQIIFDLAWVWAFQML